MIGSSSEPPGQPDTPLSDSTYPVLRDPNGYVATYREFSVAHLSGDDVQAMQDHTAPLGFSHEQWERCVSDLRDALVQSGLFDADARIRGSSTQFFSGEHKPFPPSEDELVQQASPRSLPEAQLRERWRRWGFADEGDLPTAHFFDSRYQLGLAIARSDYDIQVSSDTLAERMAAYLLQYPNRQVISPHGGHYRHEYVVELFPALDVWAQTWAEITGRDVNIAGFAGQGPVGPSGFREDDWVVIEPPAQREEES